MHCQCINIHMIILICLYTHTITEASEEISLKYRNSIITDRVIYPKMSNTDILKLVRHHLFAHIVKMPFKGCPRYYTQVTGIPQGSILSPLFCNLYYGHVEKQIFGSDNEVDLLGLQDKSLIMRLMDDYMMISTDINCVQHFLQKAHQALKPYGGGVNPLKTRVNFDSVIESDGRKIKLQKIDDNLLHWCGLVVNTETLEISNSLVRLFERPLTSSISVECAHSGLAVRLCIKSLVRMKCHAIVLDSELNLYPTVLKTVYSMFLVAAMRTHAYLKALHRNSKGIKNSTYLCTCIDEAIQFGARLIHSRTRFQKKQPLNLGDGRLRGNDKVSSLFTRCVSLAFDPTRGSGSEGVSGLKGGLQGGAGSKVGPDVKLGSKGSFGVEGGAFEESFGTCLVTFNQAIWLGLKAFKTVLSHRPGSYNKTLKFLQNRINTIEKRILKISGILKFYL